MLQQLTSPCCFWKHCWRREDTELTAKQDGGWHCGEPICECDAKAGGLFTVRAWHSGRCQAWLSNSERRNKSQGAYQCMYATRATEENTGECQQNISSNIRDLLQVFAVWCIIIRGFMKPRSIVYDKKPHYFITHVFVEHLECEMWKCRSLDRRPGPTTAIISFSCSGSQV